MAGGLENFLHSVLNNATSQVGDSLTVAIESFVGYFQSCLNVALQWPAVSSVLTVLVFIVFGMANVRQLTVSTLGL
jgi:hypothetical protein